MVTQDAQNGRRSFSAVAWKSFSNLLMLIFLQTNSERLAENWNFWFNASILKVNRITIVRI